MKIKAFKTYQSVDFARKQETFFASKEHLDENNVVARLRQTIAEMGFVGANKELIYAIVEKDNKEYAALVPTGNVAYILVDPEDLKKAAGIAEPVKKKLKPAKSQ